MTLQIGDHSHIDIYNPKKVQVRVSDSRFFVTSYFR